MARRYVNSSYGKPTPNAQIAIDKVEVKTEKVLSELDAYFEGDWKEFQGKVEVLEFDLFDLE